jgi:hypothetical protein
MATFGGRKAYDEAEDRAGKQGQLTPEEQKRVNEENEKERQRQDKAGLLGPASVTDIDPTSGTTNPIDDLKKAGGDLSLPGGYIGASLGVPGLGPVGQALGGYLGYEVGKEITPGEAVTDPIGTIKKVGEKTVEKTVDLGRTVVDNTLGRIPRPDLGLGATDTSALAADTQEARDARNAITTKLNTLTPGVAPTVQKTTLAPTSTAAGVNVGPAAQIDKTTIGPGQQQVVATPTIQKTAPVTAQTIAAPNVQHVAPVDAAKVGYIEEARAPEVQRTFIAQTPQEELRRRQLAITEVLEKGATGTGGPTAAEALLQKGQDRARREQMGQAITRARAGGNLGLAMSEANENMARIQGEGALDAAMLRAKEQQDAQGRIIQALEGTRAQDIGLATEGAKLAQGANLTEAELKSRTGLANLDVRSKTALTQAELEQEARQADAERKVKENLTEAGLGVDVAKSNQAADLSAKTTTAEIGSKEELARVELAAKVAMDNAARELAVLLEQAKLNQERGIRNAELEQQIAIAQANLDSSTQQFNAAQSNSMAATQGQITSGESKTDVDSVIKTQDRDLERELGLTGLDLQAGRDTVAADSLIISADQADKARQAGFTGSILTALGGLGAAVISDERKKKNITRILEGKNGDDELLEAFDKIRPVEFEYKNPKEPGANAGRQVGVLAQDLERSKAGKTVVTEENGTKMIELGPAVALALAGIAKIRAEMQAQKQQKGARR